MGKFKEKITNSDFGFNFEDVILLPGLSRVEPREVNLSSWFTPSIKLAIPFVSSPMDTVTEEEMAVALARLGGLGILHRNCSIEEEVEMAKRVKRSESYIIRDVVSISPSATVGEAASIMREKRISGLPVVEKGRLVGIITERDVRFADRRLKVEEAMTREVVVAKPTVEPEEAIELMRRHKIEKLPIVDDSNRLYGLITYRDVEMREKYKEATRDEEGRLRVGAAISPFDLKRAKSLSPYVDVLVIDVAHFHNLNVIEATRRIVKETGKEVVIGNLGTREAVVDSISRIDEVAGLRVGIGSGSVCTTMEVARAGAPTLFAITEAADALEELGMNIPITADGGIRGAGDVALAIACGASVVMMGYVFAGCKESPGATSIIGGRYYKLHRGMGSLAARRKRIAVDRYAQLSKEIPEGTEVWVPYRGDVATVISEFKAGLRIAMGYAGAANMEEMREKSRLLRVSPRTHTRAPDILMTPSGEM